MTIYTVRLISANDPKIYEWLETHIGPGVREDINAWANPNIKWSKWLRLNYFPDNYCYHFEFRNERDALLFTLRWG